MDAQPASYLRSALQSAGIEVQGLEVTDYSPDVFGDLVAVADTSIGKLKITYDRMFFVEPDRPLHDEVFSRLIEALEAGKRRAAY